MTPIHEAAAVLQKAINEKDWHTAYAMIDDVKRLLHLRIAANAERDGVVSLNTPAPCNRIYHDPATAIL